MELPSGGMMRMSILISVVLTVLMSLTGCYGPRLQTDYQVEGTPVIAVASNPVSEPVAPATDPATSPPAPVATAPEPVPPEVVAAVQAMPANTGETEVVADLTAQILDEKRADTIAKADTGLVELVHEAAVRGETNAQRTLGEMLRDGIGVEPDREAALDWFQKAAAQGDADAHRAIIELYRGGVWQNGAGVLGPRLRAIVLPELDLRGDSLVGAAESLQAAIWKHDPATLADPTNRLNVLVAIAAAKTDPIHLSLRNVSVYEALEMLATRVDAKWFSCGQSILLAPLQAETAKGTPAVLVDGAGVADALRKRLGATVVSGLDFKDANLAEVAERLAKACDQSGAGEPVKFTIRWKGERPQPVTFRANNMNLLETLDVLAKLVPMAYSIEADGVYIRDAGGS